MIDADIVRTPYPASPGANITATLTFQNVFLQDFSNCNGFANKSIKIV